MTTPVPVVPNTTIDPGDVATWLTAAIAVVAVVVSIFSIVEAHRARKEVRRYNDPYFELLVDPEPMALASGGKELRLQLVNRGSSPAKDVRLSFDFDPTNLFIGPLFWPLVDRGMTQPFSTRLELPEHFLDAPHRFRQLYLTEIVSEDERQGGTVTWIAPSGRRGTQRVLLPRLDEDLRPFPSALEQK